MPSPKCALRWLLFSPVPSQRTFESFGSMATQQSVKTPLSSKIGENVMPRLVVFHRPPNADTTYQVFGFLGSISTSTMRPVVSDGPMLRSAMPLEERRPSAGPGPGARPGPAVTRPMATTINSVLRVMRISSERCRESEVGEGCILTLRSSACEERPTSRRDLRTGVRTSLRTSNVVLRTLQGQWRPNILVESQ